MSKITVNLGAEYDADLRESLLMALKKLGARRKGHLWGMGGSQELESAEFFIGAATVLVETETYVGLTISGPESIVEKIREYMREK
jgi:hypothetical protein